MYLTTFHSADETIRRGFRVKLSIGLQVSLKSLHKAIVELTVSLLEALEPVLDADFITYVHLPLLVAIQFADVLV